MNSKEIIKRVIEFGKPERIGWSFNPPHENDMFFTGISFKEKGWGKDTDILREVPWFNGEVRVDPFGNIWGRLDGTQRGECIKGLLQEDWGSLEKFTLPSVEREQFLKIEPEIRKNYDKYVIGALPGMPFSISRTLRGMENFLTDVILEKENVIKLGEQVMAFLEDIISGYAGIGVDGIMFCEDWGTQNSLLVSPVIWRDIFKPWFVRICKKAHDNNMHVIMHSCGFIYEIMEDLIQAGIDVLQLDQPALIGVERLSEEFGGRIAFYCPVDIQKIMQTGNKELIQEEARKMVRLFGKFNGGFIAMDYGRWEDINVSEEWAQWARDVFINECDIL